MRLRSALVWSCCHSDTHVEACMCQRNCQLTLAAESTYRPLGSTLVYEMSLMRLSTSLSMLRATPGYWIFMAALRPSCRVARCT